MDGDSGLKPKCPPQASRSDGLVPVDSYIPYICIVGKAVAEVTPILAEWPAAVVSYKQSKNWWKW